MSSKYIIDVNAVHKYYHMGEVIVKALNGVDLKVNRGDFISIMGPSGSGKSTLLHIVGCLDRPTKGEVLLDDKPISKMSDDELALIRGKKIGFIFQTFNLIPTLTAWENVALPMWFQGISTDVRKKKAIELLTKLGLGDRTDHKPTELSGGQQQRVAIARSLSNDPEMILADEPTGNLDTKSGKEIMDILTNLNKEFKTTIVMVTHDPDMANRARKHVRIVDGQITTHIRKKGG